MVARQAALQHLSAFSVQVSASEYFSCRCEAMARLIMQLALALSTACAVSNPDLSHGLDDVVMACWFKHRMLKHRRHANSIWCIACSNSNKRIPQGPTAVQTHTAKRCSNFPVTSRCAASPTSKIWLSSFRAFIHFCTAWLTMPYKQRRHQCGSANSTALVECATNCVPTPGSNFTSRWCEGFDEWT
jgi:hypothetical protein